MVFSKDAIIQIPDKPSLFSDVFRILRPGGMFIASDWLKAEDEELSALDEFIKASTFSSTMETLTTSAELLKSSGFVKIQIRDRTTWLCEEARKENALMAAAYKEKSIELLGIEKYEAWLVIRRTFLEALEAEELRPSHLIAQKPLGL